MNRYSKNIATIMVLVLLFTLASCGETPAQGPSVPTYQQTEDTTIPYYVDETNPVDEFTSPNGEGVASIENLPTNGVQDTEPTEEAKPNNGTAPTETVRPNDSTSPTENTEPNDSTATTESTKPNGSTAPTENTRPSDSTDPTENTDPDDGPCCEYAVYLAMTPAEQQEFMKKFPNTMAFIEWCRNGETAHKEHDDSIIVEGGDGLDVGDYVD